MKVDKTLKFKILFDIVNRIANISIKKNECEHMFEVIFKDTDEWNSFKFDGKVFDIHLLCEDDTIDVQIYPVINNVIDYDNQYKIKLTLQKYKTVHYR